MSSRTGKGEKFYALKIMEKERIVERNLQRQALSERYILQLMDHPFVVKLHYAFQTKNKLYLLVDLLPGVILTSFRANCSTCSEKTTNFQKKSPGSMPHKCSWL